MTIISVTERIVISVITTQNIIFVKFVKMAQNTVYGYGHFIIVKTVGYH